MFNRVRTVLGVVFLAAFLGGAGPTGNDDEEAAGDDAFLKEHKIGLDADSLVGFFQKRTLTDADRTRLEKLVKQLGDNAFVAREQAQRDLIAAGPTALPILKPACNDPDLEIARRAARSMEAIESGERDGLPAAAVRALARRKPEGGDSALLAYLPFAADDRVEDEILTALLALHPADREPTPALLEAQKDEQPLRRAAAIYVLGRRPEKKHRAEAKRLLADADARVRLRAAQALIGSTDKSAIPTLIALLNDPAEPIRSRAEDLLFRLAGETPPEASAGTTDETRAAYRKAWEAWWRDNGEKIDVAVAMHGPVLLRRTLGIEFNTNRVWECGANGKVIWDVKAEGPMDAQVLPGNRVLIAESGAGRVTERDFKGKILWEFKPGGEPINCRRLASGNTWIGLRNGFTEVTRDGKAQPTREIAGTLHAIRRLPNGRVVYLTNTGLIGEVSAAGKPIRTLQLTNEGTWGDVDMLPNGNFLVANYGTSFVREVDPSGKKVWEVTGTAACGIERLPNGKLLIACPERAADIDHAGKVLWEFKSVGYVRRSHRR
jgi:hypothetical protein